MEEAEERSPLLPLEVKAQDPENVLEMLSNKITDEMLIKLQEDGFVIVDEALPAAVCEILRHEMDTLLENDQMWNPRSACRVTIIIYYCLILF